MEDRVTELEMRVAFQEDTIQELNRVCARLQGQVDSLIMDLEKLQKQVRDLSPSPLAAESEETPPPHY